MNFNENSRVKIPALLHFTRLGYSRRGVFLYKFLNDKFAYEAKRIDPKLAKAEKWEDSLRAYKPADYEMLLIQLGASTAQLKPEHFLSTLYGRQNEADFAKLLDKTLVDIAALTKSCAFKMPPRSTAR